MIYQDLDTSDVEIRRAMSGSYVWKVSSVKIFRLFFSIKLTFRKLSYGKSLEMYRNCPFTTVHHPDLVPLLGFHDLLHIFSDQI